MFSHARRLKSTTLCGTRSGPRGLDMPRKAKELSALAVSRLRADGRHAVGGADGLHLRVAGASRAWVLRAKVGARRCDIGLGPFPEVTLAEARDAAIDLRRQIRRGVDPLEERKQARLHHRAQRQPLQRPWLTLAIDVASRMVAGFYLTLEPPSALSVSLAIQHLVQPKLDWLESLGIDASWPAAGSRG